MGLKWLADVQHLCNGKLKANSEQEATELVNQSKLVENLCCYVLTLKKYAEGISEKGPALLFKGEWHFKKMQINKDELS